MIIFPILFYLEFPSNVHCAIFRKNVDVAWNAIGGLNASWISSFLIVVISTQSLPCLCPASFTYGEACVVSHIIGYMVFRMMTWCGLFLSREVSLSLCRRVNVTGFLHGLLASFHRVFTFVRFAEWAYHLMDTFPF